MPTKQNAGLSIKSAWEEANADVSSETDVVESDDSTPVTPPVENDEQSAVESVEKPGLFTGLDDEEEGSDEQPVVDSFEVTVNGEKSLVSLEELRSGYMRQAAHTQAMQELRTKEKELDSAATLYRAYLANPTQVAQKLWEAARQGKPNAAIEQPQAAPSGEVNVEELVARGVQEALNEHPLLKQIQGQQALDEVNVIFSQIEKDYGETLSQEDRVEVLKEAQRSNSDDVEAVFAKMYFRVQNKAKARQNVEQNSTATGYPGEAVTGITPTPPSDRPRFSSFRDAMNDTLTEENIGQEALDRVVSAL